jgi:hypothetical protein
MGWHQGHGFALQAKAMAKNYKTHNSTCHKTQIVTKLKNSNSDKN